MFEKLRSFPMIYIGFKDISNPKKGYKSLHVYGPSLSKKRLIKRMEQESLKGELRDIFYVRKMNNGEFFDEEQGSLDYFRLKDVVWESQGKRKTEEGRKARRERLESITRNLN